MASPHGDYVMKSKEKSTRHFKESGFIYREVVPLVCISMGISMGCTVFCGICRYTSKCVGKIASEY